MNRLLGCMLLVATSGGCAGTGQDRTHLSLFVAGTDVSEPAVAVGDVAITIERADLAFGPLYLCAGATAGDLCDTARLEWLETVVVDTTAPEPALAGELFGTTGPVQSYMYDLGISSQRTGTEPYVLDAASDLEGASFVVEGRAVVNGIRLPFEASIPVQQTADTELGVPVVRKSTSEPFFRHVDMDEHGLAVRFDSAAWLRGIDFRSFVATDTCTTGGPAIACDGSVERTCQGGSQVSSRDCDELAQVCLPAQGCAERLIIERDSEAYRSLRNALVSGGRPSFEWDYVP
ncbi:MAG: hypothetical protein OXU20_26665 [Myxococcales bacterium]|nr:hypothetical protein [Myxococcales bacterium]MDD9971386.1 hypothetical protein [Myxococcales bacterium]